MIVDVLLLKIFLPEFRHYGGAYPLISHHDTDDAMLDSVALVRDTAYRGRASDVHSMLLGARCLFRYRARHFNNPIDATHSSRKRAGNNTQTVRRARTRCD